MANGNGNGGIVIPARLVPVLVSLFVTVAGLAGFNVIDKENLRDTQQEQGETLRDRVASCESVQDLRDDFVALIRKELALPMLGAARRARLEAALVAIDRPACGV